MEVDPYMSHLTAKNHSKFRVPVFAVLGAVLVVGLTLVGWFARPQPVMEEAEVALGGSDSVEVARFEVSGTSGYHFVPDGRSGVGLMFYPGARVPARAYAPDMLDIAEKGHEVYLIEMPLNFAFLGWRKADDIIANVSEVDCWAVGGHSLGGAMASRYVAKTDNDVSGLVVWGSYPETDLSFEEKGLEILSIIATNDEIISEENTERSKEQFPEERTKFAYIDGGNHSQFGWYGFQSGDGAATISRQEQVDIIVGETSDFLSSLCSSD